MNVILSLQNIQKSFGTNKVLKGINLDIEEGSFVTLLGPSGCGKTTTLRLIAGLEALDSGKIFLHKQDISTLEPNLRNVNTVFQNYALFPHMNLYDNIAYGLAIRKTSPAIIREEVTRMLQLVQMEGYEKRMPNQISGGQRQRIAIARALINKPDILLLDEPLGALDLKLRQHMQSELKRIQAQTGATFVYVTHDQGEALNMSDNIVVMNAGRIEQSGTPRDIYLYPRTRFVAEFVGDRNIIQATVASQATSETHLSFAGRTVAAAHTPAVQPGQPVTAAIHTDKIRVYTRKPGAFQLSGVIAERHYTGAQTLLQVALGGNEPLFLATVYGDADFTPGGTVYLDWNAEDAIVIPEEASAV